MLSLIAAIVILAQLVLTAQSFFLHRKAVKEDELELKRKQLEEIYYR